MMHGAAVEGDLFNPMLRLSILQLALLCLFLISLPELLR